MGITDFLLVLFFTATLAAAARNIPVRRQHGNTGLIFSIAAAALSVCDYFMFSFASCAGADAEAFYSKAQMNRETAEGASLLLLQDFVNGVWKLGEKIAFLISDKAKALGNIFSASSGAMKICLASAAAAAVIVILLEKKEAGNSPETEKSLARELFAHILDETADAFLSAPLCTALAALILFVCGAPYYRLAAVILWVFSYIPFIGSVIGIIIGSAVYILSGHILYGAAFILISAAVFMGTGFLRIFIASRQEIAESKHSVEEDGDII